MKRLRPHEWSYHLTGQIPETLTSNSLVYIVRTNNALRLFIDTGQQEIQPLLIDLRCLADDFQLAKVWF